MIFGFQTQPTNLVSYPVTQSGSDYPANVIHSANVSDASEILPGYPIAA